MIAAGACACVLSLAGGGCGRTNITQPLASSVAEPEGAEFDEMEFWHELPGRAVVANGDALVGLIFLAAGGSTSAGEAPMADLIGSGYAERIEYAKQRGWLAPDFDEVPDLAVRRGVIARALADICQVRGGVMMHLLGPTERYSARELEYLGIMPPGSPNQIVTGGEFIGVIGQAQDYINYKKIEPLPGVKATLAAAAAGKQLPAPADGVPAEPVMDGPAPSEAFDPVPQGPVEPPTVVVVFDAGRPADPESRSSGVRLAVWDDGTALVATDPLHPANDMRLGNVTPEQLSAALAEMEKAGFFEKEDSVLVAPDSAYVRITARSNGVTRTHLIDSYQQTQAAWWTPVAFALEGLRPTETRPVAEGATDGAFRGYIIDEWWRTAWTR